METLQQRQDPVVSPKKLAVGSAPAGYSSGETNGVKSQEQVAGMPTDQISLKVTDGSGSHIQPIKRQQHQLRQRCNGLCAGRERL